MEHFRRQIAERQKEVDDLKKRLKNQENKPRFRTQVASVDHDDDDELERADSVMKLKKHLTPDEANKAVSNAMSFKLSARRNELQQSADAHEAYNNTYQPGVRAAYLGETNFDLTSPSGLNDRVSSQFTNTRGSGQRRDSQKKMNTSKMQSSRISSGPLQPADPK